MRWVFVFSLWLVACGTDGPHRIPKTSTCPPEIPGSDALRCTPGSSCDYDDWEHYCTCGCRTTDRGSWWECEGSVGSVCPNGPPPIDAGSVPG